MKMSLRMGPVARSSVLALCSLAAAACVRSIPTPDATPDVGPAIGPVVVLAPTMDPALLGYGGYGQYSPGYLSGAYLLGTTLYSADGWPIGTVYPGSAGYLLPYGSAYNGYGLRYGMPYGAGRYWRPPVISGQSPSLGSHALRPTPIPRIVRPRAPQPVARLAPPVSRPAPPPQQSHGVHRR